MTDGDLEMTAPELLVQRFVDGEASGEERLHLLARIGRDPVLRERLIEMERLVLEVERLPRPAVPPRFVAGVIERLTGEQPAPQPEASRATLPALPGWRHIVDLLWRPRAFEWNLAGAAVVTAMLLAVAVALTMERAAPSTSPAAGIAAAVPPRPSQVLVRLVVLQPEAATVAVAGDFNDWDPRRTPLEQTGTGAWTVTIPLDPGRYEYMFVVDGEHWMADPFAPEQTDDGFGSRNAVLDVRPPRGASL